MPLRCLTDLARHGPVAVWMAVLATAACLTVAVAGAVAWGLETDPWSAVLTGGLTMAVLTLPGAWMIGRLSRALDEAERRQRALSISDPVTGLPNSRYLMQVGAQQVHQARRFNHPLAAVLLRLDALDKAPPLGLAGVPAADAARQGILRGAVARLRVQIRESDIFCRLDDDSLILLLPETDADIAVTMIDRLRDALAEAQGPDGEALTARYGLATLTRPDLADLLSRARLALTDAATPGAAVIAPRPDPTAPRPTGAGAR